MNLQQLNDYILENNLEKLRKVFEREYELEPIQKAIAEYNPKTHAVHDARARPDKTVYNDYEDPTTGAITKNLSSIVKVSRLSIPFQKKITLISAAMMGKPSIDCQADEGIEADALAIQQKIWDDNKLDYKFMTTAEITMSEKSCAELWFAVPAEGGYWDGSNITSKWRLKMKLLAHSLGDLLYPVFDEYGDMIAFSRGYKTMADEKEVDHLDIYTADKFYFNKKVDGEWISNYGPEVTPLLEVDGNTQYIPNPIGKIPVVYYRQPLTEWHDVQEMIERLEKKISNHADTNDRFDSPILFAEGQIEGFSDKDDTGKLLMGENGSKVSYLTWNNAPESMKMEIDNLQKFIHSYTHTPDISFENLKNLGYFSTVALKTMFMDAHLKASKKETIFGEMVQRRMNYIKAAIAVFDEKYKAALKLKMTPKFTYFMPSNDVEIISNLVSATMGGIMSKETAVRQNPYVENADKEIELLGEQNGASNQLDDLNNEPAPGTTPVVTINKK